MLFICLFSFEFLFAKNLGTFAALIFTAKIVKICSAQINAATFYARKN